MASLIVSSIAKAMLAQCQRSAKPSTRAMPEAANTTKANTTSIANKTNQQDKKSKKKRIRPTTQTRLDMLDTHTHNTPFGARICTCQT